ncbi:MAG: Inner spore coat protein H [Verrucomicrobia subdivision 3 bacterium]|nr:Inner spore coat protein H [Limisphaerales bacterium]MCS1415918.1 Inner spore coat protein H [Limisphaerales bacterium]
MLLESATLLQTKLSAELILSEIMYHPSVAPGLEDPESGEFLELLNPGSEPLDLSGAHFDRGITFTFPQGVTIDANKYLVIAKNPGFLASTYEIPEPIGGYEGSLSNSGERLRLMDAAGKVLLNVRYGTHGDWPAAPDGSGHSLVFPNPAGDPNCGRDWTFSRKRKGSPGDSGLADLNEGATTRSLIQKGSTGRYFKGTKEPSNGTTAWAANDFAPDQEWLAGHSGYGYSNETAELTPVSTRLNDMRGNYLSVYLRHEFDLSQAELDQLATLMLTMHYDDGYVIYLNGARVASAGVNGNPPAFNQTSIAADDYLPHTIDLTARKDILIAGTNLLAIQGHNIGLNNSSDFILAPELDLTVHPQPTADEAFRQIVINEIQANHGTESDYVEFYNPTDEAIDMSGLWLSDDSDRLDTYPIPTGNIIEPKGFLVIPVSARTTGFGLSSQGEAVFLSAPDLSFATAYAFGPQVLGTTIGRFPDGEVNWYRSNAPSPATNNNRSYTLQVIISELMYHDPLTARNDYIEIRPVGDQPVIVSHWEMNGVRFQFDAETTLQSGQIYLLCDDTDTLTTHYLLPPETILGEYTGSLSNQGERVSLLDADDIIVDTVRYEDNFPWPITPDGLGASLERNCFTAPYDSPEAWSASPLNRPSPGRVNNIEACEDPTASQVRISEFVYNASTRTEDDRATEFIELANTGGTAISLDGWVIAGDVFYLFPEGASLAPNQCLAVAWSPTTVGRKYSLDPNAIHGPYLGELPNGGGEILLVRSDGRLADRVRYDDDFPWPSLADGGGGESDKDISLTRACLESPGGSAKNWLAKSGATPGVFEPLTSPCQPLPTIIATGTEPSVVTRQTEPIVFATFTNGTPDAVWLDYWIDDPETTGESTKMLVMNNRGVDGDIQADDQNWSARLLRLGDNSIVRYKITYQVNGVRHESPSAQRDSFPWHAYFVDPQSGTNLPNTYHLFISSANWRMLHQATQPGRVTQNRANPRWNEEAPAVFVADGVVHDVSVRHQGSRWNRKNGSTISFACESHRTDSQAQVRSWRIEFPSHRKHDGMDVILLQKQSGWPQHISFKMFELAGVPAPRTNWAQLRINGCNYNDDAFQIERPGRDLVARWFTEVGDLFKSQGFTGNEGPWSWGDARLIRSSLNGSTEQERYEHTYNRKTLTWKNNPFDGIEDAPETMIEGLHQARNQGTAALRSWLAQHFDIDRTLRYICTINYVGTFDDMFQNYYLYKKAGDGKWCMLPWDMDNTLGGAFGEATANPFRGVNESRYGNVGNRSGWWNRIKDSFFIAYEPEFLAMFHQLNNTVHSPEALQPVIEEGAALRGLGPGSVDSLMRHIRRRHDYLNRFIEPRLQAPSLSLRKTKDGIIVLEWPSNRTDYALESATEIDGHWIRVAVEPGNRFVVPRNQTTGFFRLIRAN